MRGVNSGRALAPQLQFWTLRNLYIMAFARFRPPHRATNAAPQPQRPITHLELFTGDDGSFGDGDAFVELLGGQLGALVLDGFCTPLKSAAPGEPLNSALGRRVAAFARSTAAARVRTSADAGQARRAAVLRSMALGHDQAQVWAMTHDLMRYFDDNAWPAPMKRTVYMHLLDRMVGNGDVNQTENLYNSFNWSTLDD